MGHLKYINHLLMAFLSEGLFCLLSTQVFINEQNYLFFLLQHLTSNEFTLKDSFEFAKIIFQGDAGLFMASLDVNSLFTNVPLEETINICVYELFKTKSSIHGLSKKQATKMLSLTTKESIISFDWPFTLTLTE